MRNASPLACRCGAERSFFSLARSLARSHDTSAASPSTMPRGRDLHLDSSQPLSHRGKIFCIDTLHCMQLTEHTEQSGGAVEWCGGLEVRTPIHAHTNHHQDHRERACACQGRAALLLDPPSVLDSR